MGSIALIAGVTTGICNIRLYAQQTSTQQLEQNKHAGTSWQIETYVQGGTPPPGYQFAYTTEQYLNVSLDFFSAGFVLGKEAPRWRGPLHATGRAEALIEVTPFWLAHYPAQTLTIMANGKPDPATFPFKVPASNYYGASVTPFLIRWNFTKKNTQKVVPWLQFGGGLLWTDHKFPESFYPLPSGNTSVINFTPQVGAGVNLFRNTRHSADLAVKFIHISSAGLGNSNPGIDYTIQLAAGYSWWK